MAFSMYIVLAAAIFAATLDNCSALSDETQAQIREKLKPTLEECGSKHGMTFEQLSDFKAQKKHPDDSNKCFFACVFKKIGFLDSQGLYSEDVAVKKISQYEDSKAEEAKEAAKACNSVNEEAVGDGEEGCDRAKLLFECIVKQKELHGLSF